MNLSAYLQKGRLKKANKVDMTCQFICQPSNNNLKNALIQTNIPG